MATGKNGSLSNSRTFRIVMVIATPIERTGGAGGMQSTARLVGQTLGATFVSVIFAMTTSDSISANVCLWVALAFAIVAGVFSISRTSGVNTSRKSANI